MLDFFKKNIKSTLKIINIIIFSFFYSKPKINNSKKKLNEKIFDVIIDKNRYKVFEFFQGRIFTDTNDTTAYITKDNEISEASLQYKKFDFINSKNQLVKFNNTLTKGTPKIKKRLNGNILSLISGGAAKNNFTHWLTDIIPRLMIFKKKFKSLKIKNFYVPSIQHNFQRESLQAIGINLKNVISSEKYKHITADKIYATTHPCFHEPIKVKKWSLIYLNKLFNKKKKFKNYKKIFIDRDQLKLIDKNNLNKFAGYRILLNETEIRDYLSSIGFKIIKPENFSFLEQVKIFFSADYIVGLYGASMMMLSFCKKNTKILEIKPQKGGDEFKNISKLMQLKHKQIILKPIIKSPIPQNGLLDCPIRLIKKNLISLGLKNI